MGDCFQITVRLLKRTQKEQVKKAERSYRLLKRKDTKYAEDLRKYWILQEKIYQVICEH